MRKLRVSAIAVGLASAALMTPVATAAPPTVTVGSPLVTEPNRTETFFSPSFTPSWTLSNAALSDPATSAASPVNGVVVRWRVARQPTTESFALRILHPVGDGSYVATGTSLTRTASTTWTEVFPTALPIQAGDLIGLEPKAAKPILEVVQAPGLTQSFWEPTLSDNGIAAKPKPITDIEFPFNADVQPAPQVSLVAPASGPVGGGTVVTIAGTGFDAITGVRFGDAAAHFTLDSESRITATAPGAPEGAGEVDVVVTGFAGTSSIVAADRFTYVGPSPPAAPASGPPAPPTTCVVPKLKGRNLAASRNVLRRNECRLGRVRGRGKGRTRVGVQNPNPGTVRPAGSLVNVGLR
jgi:hypothetical protein